jgi:hypothetical protein
MAHVADHGSVPAANGAGTETLGRLSPL